MADERTFNVEDRIRELGEDPATAYANARANGMAGDAPAPTALPDQADPLSSPEYPSPEGVAPPMRARKADPFGGNGASIVDAYAPPADEGTPLPHAKFSVAAPTNSGSIADSAGDAIMPDFHGTPAVTSPIEPQASWKELFSANLSSAERDNPGFHDKMLRDGYAPLIQALGYDQSENPALFNDLDDQAQARFGAMNSPSKLATEAKQGETLFGNVYMANRPLQESLVAASIAARQAKDPQFLPGIPNTVAGLHAYFIAQQKKLQAVDDSVVARSPGGLTGFSAALAGSTVASLKDPINDLALAIPVGEGGTLLRIAARDAIINGVVTAAQAPVVAQNRAELGENYTAGDFATSVAGAAVLGGVLGPALHVGGRAAGAAIRTTGDFIKTLPEDIRAKWSGRVDDKEPVGSFFSSLDNHELASLARDSSGNKLTPDELAAANVLERAQDVGESSPYQPGPAGDGAHESTLAAAIKDLEDHRTPEVAGLPSGPAADGSGAAAQAVALERPPAPSTAGRPQPSYGAADDPEAAIQGFIGKVYHAENATGNVHAQNPHSSASGPAQFTDATFRDYYRKVYGTDPGAHADRQLKDDPGVQAHLLNALTRDNAARLQHIGETVNAGNLYMMHVLGEGDGAKVFKADPSTPMSDLVSAKVIDGNPQFRGKSASEAIAWAHGKMGVPDVASVRAGAGPLEAASDDPRIAQLNDQALQLDDAILAPDGSDWRGPSAAVDADISGETRAAPLELPPMLLQTIGNRDIGVDAERFQFKSGGDEQGVTDRLQGVQQWNPMFAGLITTWQDNAGKMWIADGHQRLGLANRISAATGEHIPLNAMVMREADGISADDARTYAALKNIAEQDGKHPTGAQLVDAAKVARGFGPDALRAALPPKSALARDGAALARLSDRAFGAVYNDVVPADFAAVIGHLLPHQPEAHEAMIELLQKLDPANRGQAASIVRQAIAAGIHKEEQVDLFGTHEHVTSLMLEKAKMIEKVLGELRKMKLVHKTAAEGAETLERTGSKIAKTASEKEALANAQAIETVHRLAYRSGPVADAINAAATDLKSGRGKLAALARDAAGRIRELDLGSLDRESARNPDAGEQLAGGADAHSNAAVAADAAHSGNGRPELGPVPGEIGANEGDRFNLDGSGRGGAALEESPQLPAQRGDSEQPGLHELEQATERFSDPDGKAVQQQAQSLYHDLKADAATRREKIQAATAALEGRGELRTVEPFPEEEPGYHRFRYLTRDGQEVTGNYTVDGNRIEGLNIGDTNNPKELGPRELMRLFGQIKDQHPDVKYVHGYRMSGARTVEGAGEQEIWMELTDKGLKRLEGPPEISPQDAGNAAPARESDQPGTGQPNDTGGAQNASEGLANVVDRARSIAADLKPGRPEIGAGWSWGERSVLGNDVPKGGMVLDMRTPEGSREFVFDKRGELVAGPLGRSADREIIGDVRSSEQREAAAAPAAHVASTDVSPEQFKQVWQSKEFKGAVAAMTARGKEDMPHRESPVAEAMVRGWIDGQKGDLAQLRSEAQDALEGEQHFQPNGYNPRQGYIEAYHAAATGEPREIRALGSNRAMGVREALAELDRDPAIAERGQQLAQLGAEAPLRAGGDVDQKGEMGLGLFDHADQPELTFQIGEEGGQISAEDLLKDLDADDKAIRAIKDCL